jgi:uncharacterized membrane protein YedE/YeeE
MTIVLGLITGLAFGAVLQRGRLCFNSAFRDLRLSKDNFLFKAGIFAIALETIVFVLMAQFGWIHLNPKPLNLVGNIIGGFIFGIGMVLAGGCASGTTYRVGEGNTTSWLAAIAFGITAYATQKGAFSPLLNAISKFDVKVASNSSLYLADKNGNIGPTLATLLHMNPWVIGLIFAAILLIYVFGTKTTKRPESPLTWPWIGILVVPVAMFGFWSSTISGRPYGLGITGGWVNIFQSFTTKIPLNWEGAEVLGIVIGAFIIAFANKEFKFRIPKKGITYLQVLIGGMLMGFGAVFAGGCNIGHFLTGIPQLALSSLVAGLFFILGNWFMSWILYQRG